MKTFKLISLVLLALSMCVGFTACSSDDDSEIPETPQSSELKITSIVGGYDIDCSFSYDYKGRLIAVQDQNTNYSYLWNDDNTISVIRKKYPQSPQSSQSVITLKNGKVSSYKLTQPDTDPKYIHFSYDSKNHISSIDAGKDSYKYTWKDGNIVSSVVNWSSYEEKEIYHYNEDMDFLSFNFLCEGTSLNSALYIDEYDFGLVYLVIAHKNLLGTCCKNAINKVVWQEGGNSQETYTYRYNKSLYPDKITESFQDSYEYGEYSYKLTWEE